MRISGNTNVEVAATAAKSTTTQNFEKTVKQGSEPQNTKQVSTDTIESMMPSLDNSEETKKKVQEAVDTMNEILEANNNTSKFMYHEGLERYYVSVVDRNTEEVVKEIPPKRLLDAFYEMQKMVGMIVDEKI